MLWIKSFLLNDIKKTTTVNEFPLTFFLERSGRPSLFAAGPETPSAHLHRRIHVDEAVQPHWRDVPGLAVGQSEYGGLLQEKGLGDEQGGGAVGSEHRRDR